MNDLPDLRKHIAFVANTSWSLYNFRIGVMRALTQDGYKVFALAPRDDYSDKLTAAGITFIPINIKPHATSIIDDVKSFVQLLRLYRKYRFDYIFHFTIKANIYGSLAAGITRVPSVAVITGIGRTFQFKPLIQKAVNILYRLALKSVDAVWFLNEPDLSTFKRRRLLTNQLTTVLPSEGINTTKFRGDDISLKGHRVMRFLFAGRLLADKGIYQFVKAAEQLSRKPLKMKFEVLGFVNPKDPLSVSLNQLEEWQNNGWINYLGSHEDIRPFINRADCIVFPSYYAEGISRILLEAASMSRPIITTEQVGCRDVVEKGKTGWIIPTKSIDELVNAILECYHLDALERLQMGLRGRERVKKLFDEKLVIEIYRDHLSKRLRNAASKKMEKQEIGH